MPVIDAHAHISDDGSWFGSGLKAGLDDLMAALDAAGIQRAVVLPTFGNCRNRTVYQACLQHPKRLSGFATVDINQPALAVDEMKRCRLEYGLKGLKLHPRFQAFAPLNSSLFPIYEQAAELGWPIVFDGWLQSQTVPMDELMPQSYDRLAKQFPHLTIILAHLGGHRFWDAFIAAKANPNLYLDLSYLIDFYQGLPGKLAELEFVCRGADQKIIFGSDFPTCQPLDYLSMVRELLKNLPQDKQQNILGGNISKLLKLN